MTLTVPSKMTGAAYGNGQWHGLFFRPFFRFFFRLLFHLPGIHIFML